MATLMELIKTCGTPEAELRSEAQRHCASWARWLEPISAAEPVGEDPAYDDQFQQIRAEVNKLSGIDTETIIAQAESLLLTVCKDLRVITFYVWARLHQDGERGLAEGLELLAAAMQQYGTALHPQRPRSRQGALTWLGSARMLDSLSLWPEVDMQLTTRVFGALLLLSESMSEEERALLSPLTQALEIRLAQSGGARAVVPQNSSDAATHTIKTSESASPLLSPVSSGRDLLDQAKLLAKYLRDQPEGWLSAHHLMKSVRWDTIQELPPLDASGRTRLVPPKPDHRAHLKRLYLQQSWIELLEQTDSLFSQGVNHLWLDVQWYAWEALTRKDPNSILSNILLNDMKGLLARLPGLEALAFSDGTPFADEVTLGWISQKVMSDAGGWEADAPAVAVVQESDVLALESEALAKADAEGMDAALHWLQGRPGISSVRDRWLLRLMMARICEQFGKNEMALHLLGELNAQAQSLTLTQWSPELLFEVRARRLKLLRTRAARSESDKSRLQPEMDVLLSGLIAIDPARAAVLCG